MGHHLTDSPHSQVAIIGGGYAGIAAAVRLAEHNIQSNLFEAGKELGGRARRIRYQGQTLDNGQHILSGAYTELIRMMALVGVSNSAYRRIPLTLAMPPDFALTAWRLPAPLHLASALLLAKGLTWADRWAAIRLIQKLKRLQFRVPADQNVQKLLLDERQTATIINHLWQPLCISALNTSLETASAQIFANVLRDALAASRAASDLLLPQTDLSALFPEPAAAWLQERGNQIHRATPIVAIAKEEKHFTITTAHSQHTAEAVIIAVGPHQLDALSLPQSCMPANTWQYEPIYTLYLQYPCAVPLPNMMTGQIAQRGLIQWFFNRETLFPDKPDAKGLIAAVISASGPHQQMDQASLAQQAHIELIAQVGPLPQPTWHKIIAEKFATFACTTNINRPTATTATPGLFMAGDYISCDYPATLEAAVRNGAMAADLTHTYLKT